MKIANSETLAKMSDSQLNEYLEWLEDQRRRADFKNNYFEFASGSLTDELRRRDW